MNISIVTRMGIVCLITLFSFIPKAKAQEAGALNFGQDWAPSNDRLIMVNSGGFNSEAFTVEARIKIIAGPGQYQLVFHIGSATVSDLEIYTQGLTNMVVVFNRTN